MILKLRLHILLLLSVSSVTPRAQTLGDSLLIAPSLLEAHVQALSHDSMEGRATGSPGLAKALQYMQRAMHQAGLQQLQELAPEWLHYWASDTTWSYNVIGKIPGRDTSRFIVFSSHLDHVGLAGTMPKRFSRFNRTTATDKLFNGANDNASGTAALLALAAYYSQQPPPKYTILFIAFTGEELGLFGSRAFCREPLARSVVQNINLEMLGRPGANEPFITEDDSNSDLRKRLNKVLAANGYGKHFFKADSYAPEKLFERSDNYSFAEIGVPANTIMGTSTRDAYYHHVDDEWDTLNYPAMALMLTALIIGSWPMVM